MRFVTLLTLLACASENELTRKGEKPDGFDTGDPVDPPIEDTDDTTTTTTDDTGLPPSCDDAYWGPENVTQSEDCYWEGTEVGTFTPVVEWTNTDPGNTYTTPVIGQLTDDDGDGRIDDDDTPDLVVANTAGVLWAISGDGTTLWSAGSLGSEPMTAAIGDLDGDGFPEVVGSGYSGTIAVHGEDGSSYWSGQAASSPACGGVAIADLESDGDPEVILGNLILDGQDGSRRGQGSYGKGTGYSGGGAATMGAAADIDRDGILEVVVGNALYDVDGNELWYNGESDGFVAVADFDGDPEGEIVVAWTGNVRLQDDDGTVLWSANYTGSTVGPPTVADFDGDGEIEIGVAGHGEYEVIEADGTSLWSRPTVDYSSGFTGSSVFDFEGDGAAEVVYADENDVYVFDGATGAVKLQEATHSSATCSEYPAVADVDGDGHAEIVYTSSAYSGSEVGVRVIGDADDSWMPGRKVWNQHAYSITNVDDEGTIPVTVDANWDSYNNFRSGDLTAGEEGYSGPDLYPQIREVCVDECGEGRVTVWVSLGNQGFNDVEEPVIVDVWGDTGTGLELLHSFEWTAALPTGVLSASQDIEISGVPTPLLDVVVSVDGGDEPDLGSIDECHEDNNTANWGDVVCP
ncbi:MAG: FG-GAP-like repeat-containing protein [Myxococcota bacterium]